MIFALPRGDVQEPGARQLLQRRAPAGRNAVGEASCAHLRTVRARSSERRGSLELGMFSSLQARQENGAGSHRQPLCQPAPVLAGHVPWLTSSRRRRLTSKTSTSGALSWTLAAPEVVAHPAPGEVGPRPALRPLRGHPRLPGGGRRRGREPHRGRPAAAAGQGEAGEAALWR